MVVFCHKLLKDRITHVEKHNEATGVAHVLGNKGGVAVAMVVKDTRLCFVNSHLTAHQHQTKRRNDDVKEIIEGVKFGYQGMDVLHQFHHLLWMGDLNYRFVLVDRIDDWGLETGDWGLGLRFGD